MDKLIVRLSIIAMNVYMIVVMFYAFQGIDISLYDYIFTDSLLMGIILTTLVHSQGKYHCVWMRAMCYNLVVVPSVNFIDVKYGLFESAESCIYSFCFLMGITIISTTYLAIRHFRKVRKVLKERR